MILIITVNYNNASVTNDMINNICRLNINDDIKILVIDNNSNDKKELLHNEFTEIIFLEKNIGYFPALNKGLSITDVDKYEYIIVCNNDLLFEDSFFRKLQGKKYSNLVYAICPRVLDMDDKDQNPVWERGPSKFKMFFYTIYYKNYYFGKFIYTIWQNIKPKSKTDISKSRPIFQGYGAIYILTKNFFNKFTSLDSPKFLMEEEAFLGHQIQCSGGVQYFDIDLIVHHKEHSSCKKVPSRQIYEYSKESFKISKKLTKQTPLISDEMLIKQYES